MAVQQYLMMGTKSVSRNIITGELWTWGDNPDGQLGQGDTTNDWDTPTQVGSLTDWQNTISAYEYGMCTIKSDGTLWAWGNGGHGRLGLGDTTSRSSPVQVGSLTDWSEVSASSTHTSAIKTDGTLWTWGRNNVGQLGQGDYTDRSSPTQVGSLTDWLHIVHYQGGSFRNLAIKTDGTLWFWGRSVVAADFSSPQQVGSATDWTDVIALGDGSSNGWVAAIKKA